MKRRMKGLVLMICLCMLFPVVYAQTNDVITEQAFVKLLHTISPATTTTITVGEGNLTRETAALFIVKYLGYEAIATDLNVMSNYTDVGLKEGTNNRGVINLVTRLGIMSGTSDKTFSPEQMVTVAQASTIINRLQTRLAQPLTWQHACYAISSSSQMDLLSHYQAISFGWASLKKDTQGNFVVSTSDGTSDFKVPSGFETPVDLAKANGAETYIMVYFENQGQLASDLFNNPAQKAQVINQMVALTEQVTKDGQTRSFDGITVDFEQFISSDLKMPYVSFLKDLKTALAIKGKKMNVAVQPTLYFKGYDYKGIGEVADHVILMAHDYAIKQLTPQQMANGYVTTPLTPINQVYKALNEAVTAIADKHKIALQFSFGSIQWQSQNGKVQNSKAYTPSNEQITARLALAGTEEHFNTYYQNSYATYTANGINNTIWYENAASIQSKANLAKLLGITSVSYWRLGNIPTNIMRVK